MDKNEIRNRIDGIDDQITALFIDRMKLCAEIAAWKSQHQTEIIDTEREQAIVRRLSDLVGEEMKDYVQELYKAIFQLSRSYQNDSTGRSQKEEV